MHGIKQWKPLQHLKEHKVKFKKKHLITQVYSIPVLTRISFASETIFQVVTLINYLIYWRVGFISIQSSNQ